MSIGKRKRSSFVETDVNSSSNEEELLRASFQRAFQAKFQPLKPAEAQKNGDSLPQVNELDTADESSDEWSGISGGENEIETIDHSVQVYDEDQNLTHEKRAFMSSRPPSATLTTRKIQIPEKTPTVEDAQEEMNLKHDLALQRLLKESHLLAPTAFSANAAVTPEGKSRLKATDLRIQDLGAKQSVSRQDKMPTLIRKGIAAKAARREEKRRREAAENGIILEKAKLKPKIEKRRERGVGGPNIGKFKNGTLQLSSKDVRAIQGPRSLAGAGRRDRKRR